jgi:uncharacterized protein (TIRG00374 family)
MQILKKIFTIIFRISISVILLIFLFHKIDKKSLLEIIKNVDKPFLFLSFSTVLLNYIFCLIRWEMLLKAVKIKLPLKRIIISFAGGTFFNLFLPSTIGGDFVRSVDLAANTKKPKEILATVLLDRLSGYVGLVIVLLASIILGWDLIEDKNVLISAAIITAILILILLALFNKFIFSKLNNLLHSPGAGKPRELITNLHQEIHYFRHKPRVLLKNLALSIIIQVASPLTLFIIALSLGLRISLIYFFIFTPIIGAITLLPISLGGVGVRENITDLFFIKVGMDHNSAVAMALLNSFFILICGLIGGLIYVLTVRHRRLQYHPSPPVR